MAQSEGRSPRITHISWGRMAVEGVGSGKDFKLYPGGGRAWDWSETGTRHVPGIFNLPTSLNYSTTEARLLYLRAAWGWYGRRVRRHSTSCASALCHLEGMTNS